MHMHFYFCFLYRPWISYETKHYIVPRWNSTIPDRLIFSVRKTMEENDIDSTIYSDHTRNSETSSFSYSNDSNVMIKK